MSAVHAHILSRDSIYIAGLRDALQHDENLEISGEATEAATDPAGGGDTLAHLSDTSPDLLLIDLELPALTGAATIAAAAADFPTVAAIALYDYESDDHVFAALEAGAAACIAKDAAPKLLAALIHRVCEGDRPIYERVMEMPNVAARLARVLSKTWVEAQPVRPVLTTLTTREQNVLNQLAEGVDSRDIASALEMSAAGLRIVVRSVVAKLTENRSALRIAEVCLA
ncbi:MAG: response regulator transcription factor [Chloroflexi bacterium]|nr:response regulator transcription factor [Chloroflexota bacterium]